ncbi:MAG: hypothetical protein IT366_03075 [Candidatus Hydrogenedentes bacterium]|nr:hypothetical protein [Candidatus Hydrogenedentota bacterium]
MEHAFIIKPDDLNWATQNSLEAANIRSVPGVHCPNCGIWTNVGISYPSAETGSLDAVADLKTPRPVPLDEFKNILGRIQPVIGANRPLKPGTELGPLRGKASGKFGDFAWLNPWTVLVRESLWFDAHKAGIDLVGVPAELDFGKKPFESLLEIEALPKVQMFVEQPVPICELCGRQPIKMPDRVKVIGSTFDDSIPLQRIANFSTILVANETFARFIRERELTDVLLSPIEVV